MLPEIKKQETSCNKRKMRPNPTEQAIINGKCFPKQHDHGKQAIISQNAAKSSRTSYNKRKMLPETIRSRKTSYNKRKMQSKLNR